MTHPEPVKTPRTGISYTEPAQKQRVDELAGILGLPVVTDTGGYDFVLHFNRGRLCLSMPRDPALQSGIYVEFVTGPTGYRRKQGGREMLLRAVAFRHDHPPSVLDLTGGLGRDAFVMAGHGCEIHVVERNRIVAALLEDGLRRAGLDPGARAVAARIKVTIGESLQLLPDIICQDRSYDVIYLDPMYPQRSKSALAGKEMQILQHLLGRQNDAEQLLEAPLAAGIRRVVVKRPGKAPPLADHPPSYSLAGRSTRFDVYLTP